MKRHLLVEIFLGVVLVTTLSVGISGLIARSNADAAFRAYLENLPMGRQMSGMGSGRHVVLSGAEQTFLSSLDRSILAGALVAFVLAAAAALVLAYYLTRPLDRLTRAANALASGDLDHRVNASGPVEIERLGDAFNEMAASLSQAEMLRRQLVADVAHELRNPVAALRAQAEGLQDGVLAVTPARIGSITEDVVYLSRLVEDLRELSAADAGELHYERQTFDIADVACRELERARERAGANTSVQYLCDCAGSLVVDADEARLRQVMRNLLDNAARHTKSGSITLSCSGVAHQARVEIRDTGEGIPSKDLPHIFERFYRADAARVQHSGGSGIGLSIARRIIQDHAGSMFASNAEVGGAIVGFHLPLAK